MYLAKESLSIANDLAYIWSSKSLQASTYLVINLSYLLRYI
jgi:hypothetical protein